MIAAVIRAAVRARVFVLLAALALLAVGVVAVRSTPVDALPDNPGGSSNEAPAAAAATSLTRSNVTTLSVPATPGHSLTSPFYFNPIELYTRTQRGFDQGTKTALLDVHA